MSLWAFKVDFWRQDLLLYSSYSDLFSVPTTETCIWDLIPGVDLCVELRPPIAATGFGFALFSLVQFVSISVMIMLLLFEQSAWFSSYSYISWMYTVQLKKVYKACTAMYRVKNNWSLSADLCNQHNQHEHKSHKHIDKSVSEAVGNTGSLDASCVHFNPQWHQIILLYLFFPSFL